MKRGPRAPGLMGLHRCRRGPTASGRVRLWASAWAWAWVFCAGLALAESHAWAQGGAGPTAASPALPSDLAIVSASQWGSEPPPQTVYRSRPHGVITGLTVHHQGETWQAGADVAAYLRRLQQWSRRERAWVDVPYHYIVSPEGQVYAGRGLHWAGDSNTPYDTTGQVQVMLLGNFEHQQPSAAQLQATAQLLGQLMAAYGLAPQHIVGHRHHSHQTVCPGAHLMSVFEDLRAQATAMRATLVPR